jgi:hypothetical protein
MLDPIETPRYPNVFLIGAAKAATTSFANALGQHPDVFLPAVKEPDFFSVDRHYETGLDRFIREYYGEATERVCVDASVSYLVSTQAPQRIAESLGTETPRFIVVLREPTERAYSNYWECRAAGFEEATFEESLKSDELRVGRQWAGRYTQSHLEGSRYGTHLDRWTSMFPRDSFLFLRFEDLIHSTAASLDRAFTFIGIDPAIGTMTINRENYRRNPRRSAVRLVSAIPESVKRPLRRLVGQRRLAGMVSSLERLSIGESEIPPMDGTTRERLRALLRPEVERAAQITGLDLSEW